MLRVKSVRKKKRLGVRNFKREGEKDIVHYELRVREREIRF